MNIELEKYLKIYLASSTHLPSCRLTSLSFDSLTTGLLWENSSKRGKQERAKRCGASRVVRHEGTVGSGASSAEGAGERHRAEGARGEGGTEEGQRGAQQ